MIPVNAKGYTIAGWVGVAAMLCAVLYLAITGQWLACVLSLVFLVASVAFLVLRREVPSLLDLLFVLAALVNGAGWVWELYGQVFGYDEVVHAYTSFALSLWLGFLVYDSMGAEFRDRGLLFALAIATCGLAAGAVWEMIEYALIQIKDPVEDLMADGIGAVLAGLFATLVRKRGRFTGLTDQCHERATSLCDSREQWQLRRRTSPRRRRHPGRRPIRRG